MSTEVMSEAQSMPPCHCERQCVFCL